MVKVKCATNGMEGQIVNCGPVKAAIQTRLGLITPAIVITLLSKPRIVAGGSVIAIAIAIVSTHR